VADSFKRRLFLFKRETVYNTDSAPVAGTDAVLFMDGEVNVETEQVERPVDRGFYGGYPFVNVGRKVTISGMTDLLGAASVGTAAPASALLRACGLNEALVASTSATYTPISDAMSSASARFHHNNDLTSARGVRGNCEIMLDIKNFAKAKWDFIGNVPAAGNIVTNVALPAGTFTPWRDPPAVELETLACTLDSFALDAVSVSLKFNNDVKIYEGSETREVVIIERKPTITIRAYNPGVLAKDFYALALAGTRVAFSASVNGGASRIVTLACPALQLRPPKKVDIDGATGIEIEAAVLPNTGNDEFSLAFT
jgi:hypothetical protein